MEATMSLLYICILISMNTVLVSPLLHSTGSCDAFPSSVRFLCFKIKTLWPNDISTTHVISHNIDGTDEDDTKLVLGNVASDTKSKTEGCNVAKCKICSGVKQCTSCKYGYFLQFDSATENILCVKKCNPGYRRHIDQHGIAICKRGFQECNILNCVDCLDSHTCSVCERGYYPQFNAVSEKIICVKKCFMGYALKPDYGEKKSCKEIPSPVGCSDFLCTTCRRGYHMQPSKVNGPLCKRNCPIGHLKDRIRRKCVYWPL